MADTCTCTANSNIACSGTFGLGAYQPTCQIIPDGTRVNNPYYDSVNNVTYFSYGVFTNCGEFPPVGTPGLVQNFFVPVCENIPLSSVLGIEQLLDACPDFSSVDYDFDNSGGQPPPPGFQFLRIMVDGSFDEGGSGIYRIALAGNYPAEETSNTIKLVIDTTNRLSNLGAGAPFTFAGCPAIPRVTVTKSCETSIADNQATINYTVNIDNTGDTDLTNVVFSDIVNFDGTNITIGTVTVDPDTITVDASMSGMIILNGDLGDIAIGGSQTITYSVPIVSYLQPNVYVFSNMAMARSNETEGSSACSTDVEVVEFTTDVCCDVDVNNVTFIETLDSVGSSPDTEVTITSTLSVPSSITIQLASIGNCSAVFADTGDPVTLDTDISGRDITITCDSIVPSGSTMMYPFTIRLISIDNFASTNLNITLTLDDVEFQQLDQQILLGVIPLPNQEILEISGILLCEDV